ncbi:Uncharacterised protein [Bordetella pertussis]|nr:Uncharacterised protein [Bordetella pertussis]
MRTSRRLCVSEPDPITSTPSSRSGASAWPSAYWPRASRSMSSDSCTTGRSACGYR